MSADNMDMQSDQMFWLTWANWAAVACCNSVRIKVILYSYCTHTNYIKMKKTGWSYCPKLLNFTLAVQTVRIFSHQTNLFIHWPFSYWHYCLSVCGYVVVLHRWNKSLFLSHSGKEWKTQTNMWAVPTCWWGLSERGPGPAQHLAAVSKSWLLVPAY